MHSCKATKSAQLICLALIAASGMGERVALGRTVITKNVTWTFTFTHTVNPPVFPVGKHTGTWNMNGWAKATCEGVTVTKPLKNEPLNGTWWEDLGLPKVVKDTGRAVRPHAEAETKEASVEAGVPVFAGTVGANDKWKVKVTHVVDTETLIKGGCPGAALPEAATHTVIKTNLTGGRVQLTGDSEILINGKPGALETLFDGDAKLTYDESTKSKFTKPKDPIALTLVDETSGERWTETLLRFDGTSDLDDQVSGWVLNHTGLTLTSGANTSGQWNSQAGFSGEASSPWLVNPLGVFDVSLNSGVFQATGYWAALWQLTTERDGHVTGAFLPIEHLPWAVDYVIPPSYFTAGHTYSEELSIDSSLDEKLLGVPSPGALALVGIGAAVAVPLRRQPRR